MRTLAARAFLVLLALVVTVASVSLLAMAARSQMRFQYPPEDLRYAPARTTPLSPRNRTPKPSDIADIDQPADNAPADADFAQPPSYSPTYAPAYNPTFAPSSPIAPSGAVQPPARPAPAPGTTSAPVPPAPLVADPPRITQRPPQPPKPGGFRRVAGKTFRQQEDGFLVDTTYRAETGLGVVEVTAGSPEYTRLLEEHKQLAQYFRLADRLVVVFEDVVYRVIP